MATLQDLETAIDQLLGHPLGAGNFQLNWHVEEKAYEAYVFGLCLEAARELGVTPNLRGINEPQIHSSFAAARAISTLRIKTMDTQTFQLMATSLKFTPALNSAGRAE